ncbi:alkane 1-monooxygenase [Actibacterium sp. XHP0104]|uniref:alkane 1-monooxygenase n=1 Tax=Actibacterium sp. XHP0104 TaxID=2984335 RepID=UPI0021E7D53E|nr:alkane 1-monooxygenase [Actibacterium sp. XHP0104]MCV2881984.1 alkane 1-monooxygenase [Actibacterium sp. XHP0104]
MKPTLRHALPFWLSLGLIPMAVIAAIWGSWTVLLLPFYAWWLTTFIDLASGLDRENLPTETARADLFWYRLITLIWFPVQAASIYGMIWWVTHTDHLSVIEIIVLFFGVGTISGTVGIVYSHELMHQKTRLERWMADLLLGSVLYSHFRSEHLLVHHRHVGTPRDAVTARFGESFYRFILRVLRECPGSAWRAEAAMLARKGLPATHRSNPFWRYGALQLAALALAVVVGGWVGLLLFVWQAISAIWQLELTNYIEHYGLTRKHLGDGKYEHVQPHHSWNAAHRGSNWLLINLQRHSDHHYKPDRPFPLLQNHGPDQAPQLPLGYPVMGTMAMVPPLWRYRMDPRVRAWRRKFYPEIDDWAPYDCAATPQPRGA